jgi:putative endonuclease
MAKYHNYYVYITTNPKKTVLYTGVTNDLDRRMEEHLADNLGKRKTFAGKYFCYNLIYYEYYAQIEWAIAREKFIKKMHRKGKEQLIARFNPAWRFLNDPAELEKGDLPVWIIGEEPWDGPPFEGL